MIQFMNTWDNGADGGTVRKIINDNFSQLEAAIAKLASGGVVLYFTEQDWIDGKITIEYSSYNKMNPCVDLFININGNYSMVYGGYTIKDDCIELYSDMPYECKVVIR